MFHVKHCSLSSAYIMFHVKHDILCITPDVSRETFTKNERGFPDNFRSLRIELEMKVC